MIVKTFFASVVLAGISFAPLFAFAQETVLVEPVIVEVVVPATPESQLQAELAELKLKEADPTIGFMNRFFIRIKIKELENKLNIATALK